MKKIILLVSLALCLILPLTACAQAVQPDKPCTLTLSLSGDGEGVPGATFRLYRVAAMNRFARFDALPGFDVGDVDLNEVTGAQAWQQLTQLCLAQIGQPDAVLTTGVGGKAIASDMPAGLYLLVGQSAELGHYAYSFEPYMISLPGKTGDNWDYTLTVDVKYQREPLTTNLKVVKVWQDEGFTKLRPEAIEVELYADGVLYMTVELNAANNWTWEFTGLETLRQWTVQEKVVPEHYSASYSVQNDALVITNTVTAPPTTPPDIPQTGLTWWPVPLLAVLGLALVIAGWAMRRKWSQEHDRA